MSPKGGKRPGAGRKPKSEQGKRLKLAHTLPPHLLAYLDRRAAFTGKSRSDLIAEALEAMQAGERNRLGDLSDEVDGLVAEGRWTKEESDRITAEVEKVAQHGDDYEFLHMAAKPGWYPIPRSRKPQEPQE